MNNKTRLSPEYAAKFLLKELDLTQVEDLQYLEEIAWRRGAMIRYRRLDGSEARLSIVGRKAIITVSDAILDPHRIRFSIAHELGHLEMRHYDGAFAICTSADLNVLKAQKSRRDVEWEANQFASAFLMPEQFFRPMCGSDDPSLDFVSQLALHFNVSLTAAALRYIRFCHDACAIVYSEGGRVEWFAASEAFKENRVFIETKVKLNSLTQAGKSIRGLNISEQKQVYAALWFAPGRYDEEALIWEQSWYMRNYDSVLTLLWIDDDIFNEDDWLY